MVTPPTKTLGNTSIFLSGSGPGTGVGEGTRVGTAVGVAVGRGVGVGVGAGVGRGVGVGICVGNGVGAMVRSTSVKQADKTNKEAIKAKKAPLTRI